MTEEEADLLIQYHNIALKLKKKRILRKPNLTEACQQFESLAVNFERKDLIHYSALCNQAAAKCKNLLGNTLEEGLLLLKSSRQYMSSYLENVNFKFVSNVSCINHSHMLYEECLERLSESEELSKLVKEAFMGSITLEMADNLKIKADFAAEDYKEYKKAIKLFSNFPVEKINCVKKVILLKIEEKDYRESLNLINDLIKEAHYLPESGLKENTLRDLEITRIFLILLLQPTLQQISPANASSLEKYAWVETSNKSDFIDLSATLSSQGLSMLSEDLFLNLQSLVMACQYSDPEGLELLEKDLVKYISNEQKSLLQILIEQYKN